MHYSQSQGQEQSTRELQPDHSEDLSAVHAGGDLHGSNNLPGRSLATRLSAHGETALSALRSCNPPSRPMATTPCNSILGQRAHFRLLYRNPCGAAIPHGSSRRATPSPVMLGPWAPKPAPTNSAYSGVGAQGYASPIPMPLPSLPQAGPIDVLGVLGGALGGVASGIGSGFGALSDPLWHGWRRWRWRWRW